MLILNVINIFLVVFIFPHIDVLVQDCSTSIDKALELFCSLALIHVNGLVQDCSNSMANALELLQSCAKPSIWFHHHALPGQRRLPRSQVPFAWHVTTVFPRLLLPRGVLPLTQPNMKVWLKVRSRVENPSNVVFRSLPGATELSKTGQSFSATQM